jgi:Cu/Zn superoxide dismutase
MKQIILAALAAISVVAAPAATAQAGTTVNLKAQNNSGENGTVTLTPQGDKTQIVIKLTGAPAGVAQPAHIHDGTCAKLDPKPRVPLQNVTDGTSTTVVGMKLDDIVKQGGAINVHKSADDLKTYVACGDLKAGG